MPDLEITGLYKSFDNGPVLRQLDLAVDTGTFVAILGPSGSGKTTLLHVIAGFERADAGTVLLNGAIADNGTSFLGPEHRHIGYVPQEGSLFPHLTVEQNVGFGVARSARRSPVVGELMEMVGVADLAGRYPHQLSGGQQQRVASARALAIKPALVLLDEPFSSLDESLRSTLRADVRRVLQDAKTTTLLVTHDQDEALSLADRVAVLGSGKIVQYDTPHAIYTHPLTPKLARSVGEANFLNGHARDGRVATALGNLSLDPTSASREGAVEVLIRPEQIHLIVDPSEQEYRGHVTDLEFFGHDVVVRVQLDAQGAPSVVVRRAGGEALHPIGSIVGCRVSSSVMAWPLESD